MDAGYTPIRPEGRALSWQTVLSATLPLLLVPVVSALGLWISYLVFHVAAGLFSIVVALVALLVASVSQRRKKNDFLIYMAIVIGWCAVIDLCHMLAFKGMGLLPGDSANSPTQLWVAARFLQALGMLTAPLFLHRRLRVWMAHVAFGLGAVLLVSAVGYGVFPDAYIDGRGLTPFKIYSEYLIVLMLAAALFQLWRGRALLAPQMLLALTFSMVAMILSELAFTQYVSVYGAANLVGHLFKILAYWFILIALVEWALNVPFALLQESEARYARSVNSANDGLWEWSPSIGKAYLSPRWKQLLGFDEHELPDEQKSFFDRIHPEDEPALREAIRAHFEEAKPFAVELRLKRKSGDYRWFYTRGLAERDAQGRVLRMSGSITDIGELKKAQLELAEKATTLRERGKELRCLNDLLSLGYPDPLPLTELLQSAVGVLPQGWLYDDITCARIVFENTSFTTDNFRETAWTLAAPLVVEGQALGLVEVFYLEERQARDTGPFLAEEVELIRGVASQLGAKLVRLRADERVRQSEARFRQIFDNNASVLLLIEPESGAIVDVNAAAAEFYGYPADVMSTMLIDDINILGAAESLAARRRAVREERDYFIFPHRVASGEVRTVEVRSSPVNVQGRVLLFSIVTDVTKTRLAEAALKERTAEIMARNVELTRFSAVAVDRELRMIELKREVNALCARLGEAPPYETPGKA